MIKGPSDPRAHLLMEDQTDRICLGPFQPEGAAAGCIEIGVEIMEKLSLELRDEYKQARREGFVPVLVTDLFTGVAMLEMRKHIAGNN